MTDDDLYLTEYERHAADFDEWLATRDDERRERLADKAEGERPPEGRKASDSGEAEGDASGR